MGIKLTANKVITATWENISKGDILSLRKASFFVQEKTPNEVLISSFNMPINAQSRMSPTQFNKFKYKHTGMSQSSLEK